MMADAQTRAAEVLAAHTLSHIQSKDVRCKCGWSVWHPLWDSLVDLHRAHVAAALSEAGLLADGRIGSQTGDLAHDMAAWARRLLAERDTARAALDRVRALADEWVEEASVGFHKPADTAAYEGAARLLRNALDGAQ